MGCVGDSRSAIIILTCVSRWLSFCLFCSSIGPGAINAYLAICWKPTPYRRVHSKFRCSRSRQSAGNPLSKDGRAPQRLTRQSLQHEQRSIGTNWKTSVRHELAGYGKGDPKLRLFLLRYRPPKVKLNYLSSLESVFHF
jgi:hypothetical protein